MYQQHILLKLRKPVLKYTINQYHVHLLSSFKRLNLPNTFHYMADCLYLHDSYITKFDFMKYALAKLVVHGSKYKYLLEGRMIMSSHNHIDKIVVHAHERQ